LDFSIFLQHLENFLYRRTKKVDVTSKFVNKKCRHGNASQGKNVKAVLLKLVGPMGKDISELFFYKKRQVNGISDSRVMVI
jgi:hypothetical protein